MPTKRVGGKSQSGPSARPRRSAPKTKTGCLTCKIRRVKCDEGKPGCRRCRAFGTECDGYRPRSRPERASQKKTLFPRVSSQTQLLPTTSESVPCRSDTQLKDLWEFQIKTASEFTGAFEIAAGLEACQRQLELRSGCIPGKLQFQEMKSGCCLHSEPSGSECNESQRAAQFKILPSISGPPRDCHCITLFRQPNTSLFENEDEHQYFRFFSSKTVGHIAGCYNPLLWNRSVLQACEGERSILYAAIAIGALDLSFKTGLSHTEPTLINHRGYANAHYRFSLLQYNKAIKQMRETIQKRQDFRTTLLASILIIVFEIYHGNHESAIDQIKSSVQLLENWTKPRSKLIGSMSLSPSPYTVEDDLCHAFYRLEIEGMVFLDKIPVEDHISRSDDRSDAVEKMPEQFQNVSEAQLSGKILMRRCIHFIIAAWNYDKDTNKPPDNRMYILDKIQCNPTPESLAERDKHSKQLSRWFLVFTPLLERAVSGEDIRERHSAICLHIHYLCTCIAMDCLFRKTESFFDSQTPTFIEILSLARVLLANADDSFFIFDSQAILPLEIVARKCRDPVIRREAIELMFSIHRREGFMDSIVMAKTCSWLLGIEEEGMVGNRIPEEARARSVRAEPGSKKGTLHVWCELPKTGGELGEVVIRDTIIK